MDPSKITGNCTYDEASLLSKLCFAWVLPLFRKGWRQTLTVEDLYKCSKGDDPRNVSLLLEEHWLNEKKLNKKPSLARALYSTFIWKFVIVCIPYAFVECVLRTAQPFFLGVLTRFFSEIDSISQPQAYWCAMYIILSSLVVSVVRKLCFFHFIRFGMRIRGALEVLMYKKILKLSKNSMSKTSVGQVTNMMSNDLWAFEVFACNAVFLVIGPIQVVTVVFLLWRYLNLACFTGITILALYIPMQMVTSRLFYKYRRQTTEITDERIKLMSEIVSAMRLIKVYCWEKPFSDIVCKVRKQEIGKIRKKTVLDGLNMALGIIGSRLMVYGCFVTYVLMGNSLNAEIVFTTMSLFQAIEFAVVGILPRTFSTMAECAVACKRLETLLGLPEKTSIRSVHSTNGAIRFHNYSAKWDSSCEKANIEDLSLDVKPEELVIICGAVGSGKTCVLNALLDEIHNVKGIVSLGGTVSYAPQEAWCFAGTIRSNILIGNNFNEVRYKQVVDACGLERDISIFPNGDQTLVGEKGYTLSGGQKARVTLARAVYNDADIYLLDDPLSAVDPAVAKHIFEHCIKGFLKNKTIILVTHQLQFLKGADEIVLLKDCKAAAIGNFDQLMSLGIDFVSFLGEKEEDEIDEAVKKGGKSGIELFSETPKNDSNEELMSTGSVKGSVYWDYLKAGTSVPVVLIVLISVVCAQALWYYVDFFLSQWTTENEENTLMTQMKISTNETIHSAHTWENEKGNLISYTTLIVLLFITALLKMLGIFAVCLRSSTNLHDRIFFRLLQAPMSFFDSNPMGRVLNRFTRDVGSIDQQLPYLLGSVIDGLLVALGIVVLSSVVMPFMLVPSAALAVLAYFLRKYYMRSARVLKRLDAVSKSPVYSQVTTTFNGLSTIRAFGIEDKFIEQFLCYMSDAFATHFYATSAGRTMAYVVDLFSVIFIAFVTLVLVAFPDGITAGYAGLALSSALMMLGTFNTAINLTADVENSMISVERVLEYGKLEVEVDKKSEPGSPISEKWPETGSIEYRNVYLKYPKGEKAILSNLNFTIRSGEKIGVVGRTGAGKSSLITVLFRLVHHMGEILIDGVDTTSVGLKRLRSNISIIPQDPVLFSGTIRRNLDPFNEFGDDALWNVLKQSNLHGVVGALDGGLEADVTEGGSNLSAGQRQLLCLARALLRNNKILVLDEATANVDHETDELIQKTIRTQFVACTVLTIAHRLNTVIDMDKILVLDEGRVMQFGSPHDLVTMKGLFRGMVEQTGAQMSKVLFEAARKA